MLKNVHLNYHRLSNTSQTFVKISGPEVLSASPMLTGYRVKSKQILHKLCFNYVCFRDMYSVIIT